MKILVCGADGFLGRHFVTHLRHRGHAVTRGVHRPRRPGDIALDYRQDLSPECWLPRLADVDVAINAVGILREQRAGDFDRLHHRAPAALFEACARLGVRRVLHISALGAATTPYLSSKHAGDDALRHCLPQGVGVAIRPGLVFGNDGASSRFFLALASMPLHAIPLGAGRVQPLHLDDLTTLVAHLVEGIENGQTVPRILEVPGPRRLRYAEWLAIYRDGLGLAVACRLPLPVAVTIGLAWFAGRWPGSLLTPATWRLLRAGSCGDPTAACALLGRPLRDPALFIDVADREVLRGRALAAWRRPAARAVLATIWLITALLSAGVHPIEESLSRLAAFHLAGIPALVVLAAAILLDALLGLASLLKPGTRLWQAQLLLVITYSALVAWRLPGYLSDPFGPILKNIAVIALLLQIWAEEEKP